MSGQSTPSREHEQEQAEGRTICIALTKGATAIIDETDRPLVEGHRWHLTSRGYAARRVGNRIVLLHRLLMGARQGQLCDHINGDRRDNRRSNLRFVTPHQSSANTSAHKDGASRFKGVYRAKGRQKWAARIMAEGKCHHLGCYVCEEDAALAYDRAARLLSGPYARLNFPEVTS